MRKIFSILVSILTLTLFTSNVFAAGDAENVKKLSSFKKTGTQAGIVIPQDTKFAANIKKNILPKIKMPPGFKIELFALAPDARHMAAMNNLSNSLSPMNNSVGNFIGDVGAFGAGLVNEVPAALTRGFNKENRELSNVSWWSYN